MVDEQTSAKPRVSYDTLLLHEDMALKGWNASMLAEEVQALARANNLRISAGTVFRFLRGSHQTANTAKWVAQALGRPVKRYLRVEVTA